MNDATLFGMGCGVVFLFLAGVYLLARSDYHANVTQRDAKRPASVPSTPV
ncbi:MAG: hypothetical protein GWP91_18815 [Rhodobacterales bacterium]|nr:hypothetical protein [Rhodobacterales bacterium]